MISITLAAFVVATALLLKNPDRRSKLMSVFRGRTATVQYTRVSGVGSTQIDKLKKSYLFSQECAPVCLISF